MRVFGTVNGQLSLQGGLFALVGQFSSRANVLGLDPVTRPDGGQGGDRL